MYCTKVLHLKGWSSSWTSKKIRLIMENQINGLENGLKRSKNVTKIVVD